ncbi:MAG: signal peptidase II [Oscillospiraceae bacterium]|nr:signal peptidase II [Oscillospiraceae bacterium]
MKKYWLLLALPVIALDRWVKWWASDTMRSKVLLSSGRHYSEPFIPGVDLTYATNTGASFSFLAGGGSVSRWFLVGVSALAVGFIILAVLKNRVRHPLTIIALAALLGGAAGNLIDRVYAGYVVDMFKFTFVEFAIFNVADVFITVGGAAFVILYALLEAKKGEPDAGLDQNG